MLIYPFVKELIFIRLLYILPEYYSYFLSVPYLSILQPQLLQVDPPHKISFQPFGFLIFGCSVLHFGQKTVFKLIPKSFFVILILLFSKLKFLKINPFVIYVLNS